MRLLTLALLTILLLPLDASRVHADEVKYKSRDRDPPSNRDDGVYKRQPDNRPSDNRPPDRDHPDKRPPDDQPSNPDQPKPPEPWHHPVNLPSPRGCPPKAGCEAGTNATVYIDEPLFDPISATLNSVLSPHLAAMQTEGFVGQVVVGHGRQIDFQRNDEWRRYDIGAVAESFTAWAVYQLIDARRLSLNTTVGVLFPAAPADKRDITIEQLLSHTSGLGNTRLADGEIDRSVAVARLLSQSLEHEPGLSFTYSADGYVILAATIEIVSARDYDGFLWESGVISPDMSGTMCAKYGAALQQSGWGMRGVGGILSTAPDLFAWVSRFLESPAMPRITEPRWSNDEGMSIGHGWYWTERPLDPPLLETSGWIESGDNVTVVAYPNDVILVVASDRTVGGIPWSERVAMTLEPILRDWSPVSGFPLQTAESPIFGSR